MSRNVFLSSDFSVMMRTLILVLFTCVCVNVGRSQEIIFTTEPAARRVGLEDPFQVRYRIQNSNRVRSFELPVLRDFQILGGPSKSNQISIVNGERTVSLELIYVMKAKRTGTLILPGGIVVVDGREIRSNNMSIEVIPGSVMEKQPRRRQQSPFDDPFFQDDPFADDPFAAIQKQHQQMMQALQRQMQGQAAPPTRPQRSPAQPNGQQADMVNRNNLSDNLFIRVDVDKKTATVGEQVTASYKMYTRVPMEVNLTKLPSLNGFWSQDFKIPKPPKPRKEIFNGKEYQVFEIKRTALFPTQSGTLTLDPAEAEGIARVIKPTKVRRENPFGDMFEDDPFFNSFFGSMLMSDPAFDDGFMTQYDFEDVPVKLKSTPIQIEVKDVPADRPLSFKGAVGQYQIESNIDRTELSTDDLATITLRVSGTGNLKLIGAPEIKVPVDLDALDPTEKDTITNTNDIIAGYKTFSYAFAPRVAGQFLIPGVEFSFYDPETQQFVTRTTPSYTLNVKPGKGQSAGSQLPRDIHDIHSSTTLKRNDHSGTWPASPWYWGGFGLPVLAYLGLILVRRREDAMRSDLVLFKNKKANKIALQRLALAERYLKQSNQSAFYEETSKAVWLYLSDKLNIPLSALSKEVAADKMKTRSVSDTLQQELFRITNECEMALYAPDRGALQMHQTYSDAFKLIGKLEDFLSA